jgi:hypothetical protein
LNSFGLSSTKCADLQTGESKAAVGDAEAAAEAIAGRGHFCHLFRQIHSKNPLSFR